MEKESFLEKIKKIKYFFIEKPKNKQKEEDIIQINEVDKEDETFNTENQVEILNEENQIDEELNEVNPMEEELNIDDQVEVLNAVNPMEEVEEPLEQKTDEKEEKVETQKEYTTVDYNSILKEQEERIKKAGTIPEEEKQKQIDELYKNFELFVGETNNSGKTR